MVSLRLTRVSSIFALLCAINMLNYIDRGIIPGSPVQFQGFISRSLKSGNATTEETNTYMGLLVSAFIAGYSVFSIAFGYWAIYYRPFVLIAVGMTTWCVAMVLCGLSEPFNSLPVLIIGRVLSGVGESSFQAIAPSFIDDHAPPAKRTLWLGIFYCGITVGTALGYFYSALFASSIGWPWAFHFEGIMMVPLVLICMFCMPAQFNVPAGATGDRERAHTMTPEVRGPSRAAVEIHTATHDGDLSHECIMQSTFSLVAQVAEDEEVKKVSLPREIWSILTSPLFMLVALGSAAYIFSISGLGAFGPSLLIGLGLFEESSAAMVFGAILVVAGTIGTLLGGLFLDRSCALDADNEEFRMYKATRQLCMMLATGTAFLVLSWIALDWGKVASIAILAIALAFLFGCVPASVVAILLSVDKRRRGLALGINTLLAHVLGDVPSPIVLGMLKDKWAPDCNTLEDGTTLNPLCANDRAGLKQTLLFPYLWLIWAIVLAAVAVEVARRKLLKKKLAIGVARRETVVVVME
ncbi:Major Facilitator Superfamily (MFS) [Achlya hypogyna]|uniref:Major Facilitator Superfamily (MFS) n=1 Tax=Achlya hypogyna TaxID=1202772 RepID=A0A1V9ZTU3_ACHHY|nr:Major Facilitator Superfamily (MFS) [Achlya hypogyna]